MDTDPYRDGFLAISFCFFRPWLFDIGYVPVGIRRLNPHVCEDQPVGTFIPLEYNTNIVPLRVSVAGFLQLLLMLHWCCEGSPK